MASELPAAILLDPNDGCLTIARSLVRRGIRVHVLARARSAYVAHSRGVEGSVLPDLPGGSEVWLARLGGLARLGDGVLISGSDQATELIATNRAAIPAILRSFEGPETPHLSLMDKGELYEIAEALGVRTPWTLQAASRVALEAAADTASYPCILKPALSHVGKRAGGFQTQLAPDPQQLIAAAGPAVDGGVEMLVTEFVPGGEENLEGAVTIRAPDGSYPLVYGRRKVRQYPLDFGPGSLTMSASVPETIAANERILDAVGFVGVSSLEMKRHAETGELVLVEINVRVVQSFGLGDACGVDASWRLYATLAGIPLGPQPAQRDGKKVVSPAFDLLAARARLRRKEISWRGLLASYRGTRDLSVLDPRDPRPALTLAGWGLRSRVEKVRARRAKRGVLR